MAATFEYDGHVLTVKRTVYSDGRTLALLAFDEDGDRYGVLTVNLADPLGYLDTEPWCFGYLDINNWPGIKWVLRDADWCRRTGHGRQSGFVEYPLYEFDIDKIEEVDL